MEPFRVALSGDFRKADGSPTYPDLRSRAAHRASPASRSTFLDAANGIMPAAAARGFRRADPARPPLRARKRPQSGRLAVVARFGVGYDTVDVDACTDGRHRAGHHAGRRAPPGRRLDHHLMLALTGKLMVKDRLTREAAAGFAKRSDHMGVGLVGRTLGSLGIGNIGAEIFRLAKPFDMKFIAHDPFADKAVAAELGIELVGLEERLPPRRHPLGQLPADRRRPAISSTPSACALMKPTRLSDQHGARPDRRPEGADQGAAGHGAIAGAGLDVLEQEPPDADDPILKLDNVILAPHALCWTDQCFAGNGAADVKAVLEIHARPRAARRRQPRRPANATLEATARRSRRVVIGDRRRLLRRRKMERHAVSRPIREEASRAETAGRRCATGQQRQPRDQGRRST